MQCWVVKLRKRSQSYNKDPKTEESQSTCHTCEERMQEMWKSVWKGTHIGCNLWSHRRVMVLLFGSLNPTIVHPWYPRSLVFDVSPFLVWGWLLFLFLHDSLSEKVVFTWCLASTDFVYDCFRFCFSRFVLTFVFLVLSFYRGSQPSWVLMRPRT